MKKSPARSSLLKKEPTSLLEKINSSIDIDKRLFNEDIEGSVAHCQMLIKSKIVTKKEGNLIIKGLQQIKRDIKQNKIIFDIKYEDIHMNIENILTKKIGSIAGKLHTARSRNDQVVTDLKLWIKKNINFFEKELKNFQKTLLKVANKNISTVMPGYTHMQVAQPVSLAHHLLAYIEMIGRDRSRLYDCLIRLNENPLGAAALAGTSFNIDRKLTTKLLGFKKPTANSIDSVSDRDFVIEFIFCLTLLSVHLSRLSEEIVLWSSQHFQFIELPDELSTGSSIMPQKRNPDGVELIRGKSAIAISNLNSILSLIKNMPLAYSKDLQEDKKLTFETFDSIILGVKVLNETIGKMAINKENMLNMVNNSQAIATDLADWLVRELNFSFRESYKVTGNIVRYASSKNKSIHKLKLNELQKFEKKITSKVFSILSAQNSIKSKKSIGGTSPQNVKQAIKEARKKYL